MNAVQINICLIRIIDTIKTTEQNATPQWNSSFYTIHEINSAENSLRRRYNDVLLNWKTYPDLTIHEYKDNILF
jgi:hypothetical protein